MVQPELSIIFPTYERPDEVTITLDRLRDRVTVPHEVFVLDNSGVPLQHAFAPHEHYVFLGRNLGTAARNLGLRDARARVVLMLDDDSHPEPGTVERALGIFEDAPGDLAGLIGDIERPDGDRESALLPTVFHGCGVFFLRDRLLAAGGYPEDFCYFGEEYWVTLALYARGWRLGSDRGLRFCHRVSSRGRDRARIFYHLARNNDLVWEEFVPSAFLEPVLQDSRRRYELLSRKERVEEAYSRGRGDRLAPPRRHPRLDADSFRRFSRLAALDAIVGAHAELERAVLCGTGKFPELWAGHLLDAGLREVAIADFNPGLVGETFGSHAIHRAEDVPALIEDGFLALLGHASEAERPRWEQLLAESGVAPERILEVCDV